MHGVALNDGEIALLKEAKEKRDWTILPTFKLKYLYQRLVALPRNDLQTVRDISNEAKIKLGKIDSDMVKEAEKIFGVE
jgi:hypothetical protein